MWQDHFIVDGQRHYTGTIFVIKNHMGTPVEASFVCYDTERQKYVYNIGICKHYASPQYFQKMFVHVTNKADPTVKFPVVRTKKDRQIDGLFIGWVWYIFLMAIATIFNGNIVLWIFISYVFFTWRAGKIKKEGTYIEW